MFTNNQLRIKVLFTLNRNENKRSRAFGDGRGSERPGNVNLLAERRASKRVSAFAELLLARAVADGRCINTAAKQKANALHAERTSERRKKRITARTHISVTVCAIMEDK